MKNKIVGIFVMTLLITTACSVLSENNIDNISEDYEVVMFMQEPEIPENEPLYLIADIDDIWRPFDDFWDLTSPIREIHWWSTAGRWEINDEYPSDPEGSIYTITFCEDDGTGKPGDIVCTYENVMPTITGTGMMYDYPSDPDIHGPFELYSFKAVLSSSCDLSDGWVSIVKTDSIHHWHGGIIMSKDGNDICWSYNVDTELWWDGTGYDFSFVLIGYTPDLTCDGEIDFVVVKLSQIVPPTNITVENTGGPGSLLDWRVETNMDWGDWTFSPESGDGLTPEDGPVNITVTVAPPNEKNTEFTGELYLVNKNDEQDKCIIPVTVTTSKTKSTTPFLTFFENHPYLFPLLRQILGL